MTTWSEKMLQVLRRMNNFYSPGSSRTTCLRFEVGGEQVGWVPSKVASILSKFPEKYEVMPRFCDTPLMCMERSATSLFGVKRYGVHINGYCQDENGELRMWVGRRSMTKQTYPGKLDNLAAGGLAAGISVKNTLIKECEEEACIPADIAETARPVSTVSYTYEDEEGVFPESQFVFDLELPPEFKPRIGDGEVQDFYLYSMDKLKEVLVSDDFKPNCAMVVLDFLIRHSYIQPDTGLYQYINQLHGIT
ncbi:unnamed protein product [Coregonus sp. 'balchen']|nr:unnamed protein product [Coregonus sp. 'balchen']